MERIENPRVGSSILSLATIFFLIFGFIHEEPARKWANCHAALIWSLRSFLTSRDTRASLHFVPGHHIFSITYFPYEEPASKRLNCGGGSYLTACFTPIWGLTHFVPFALK